MAAAAGRPRHRAAWPRSWAALPSRRSPTPRAARSAGSRTRVTNLGASIGTALAGTILIAVLTTTFLGSVAADPAIPQEMSSKAQVELSAGIPFVSDADLYAALAKANVPTETADAIVRTMHRARINGLRAALAVLALLALAGLALHPAPPDRADPARAGRRRAAAGAGPPPARPAPSSADQAAPQRHAAPGALAAGGACHAAIEAAPGQPDARAGTGRSAGRARRRARSGCTAGTRP